ncbi:L-serine ammonia-lyase, iron-sulfur-dependent, subunit alpha [Clostridium sp. AN503]|uniref:L-cysteine desulfidase family protein n=1 Tax=Clostridium sp. AN503 TaxID=3160598 RepID=UPI00345ADD89
MQNTTETQFIKILEAELVKALGCTEPIAIAYAGAVARDCLGSVPEEMTVSCSGNIIKNAKAVVVPMTRGLKGIEAAAIAGAVGGDARKGLEVLTGVTDENVCQMTRLLEKKMCRVQLLDTEEKLHIILVAKQGDDRVEVELMRTHLGVIRIEKNRQVLWSEKPKEDAGGVDYSCLNMDSIFTFATEVPIGQVEDLMREQILCNTSIAQAGLSGHYGAEVGKTLLEVYGTDVWVRAKAVTAAGSDARMNGCELPVVINSGSGNQGMTVSLPVIEYAASLKCSEEQLCRALVMSNLIAIYLKYQIGRLSAYCGVVTAAAGAGAGITYLMGGSRQQIEKTVLNTLADTSGIVCDGASASCAAKIATSVDAAVMSSYLSMNGHAFLPGEGIVKDNLQKTVDGVITLAKEGMKKTDEVILEIMIQD